MRSVSNAVMQGDTPGLPSVPACTGPRIPQLMAQPCHYTQLGLRKATWGLPALAQIRPGESARYLNAVWNIRPTDQYETVKEGYRVFCTGAYIRDISVLCKGQCIEWQSLWTGPDAKVVTAVLYIIPLITQLIPNLKKKKKKITVCLFRIYLLPFIVFFSTTKTLNRIFFSWSIVR